jgi:HAE1 family hydrophobic/amphiphilic exporter-1
MAAELPQLSAYFQSGGLVDAVLNLGLPAPIDIQIDGANIETVAQEIGKIPPRAATGVEDPHSGREATLQELVEQVDVDLAEELLQFGRG